MNKIFVFDYDDTLAWNQHDYDVSKIEFQKFIIEKLGHHAPDCSTILKTEENIDSKNVEKLGFSMKRFPTSLKQTYRFFCEEAGITPDPKAEEEAFKIGMLAFNSKRYKEQGLAQGVEETLEFIINEKKDSVFLLTKGDPKIQKRKIKATNIKKWFGKNTRTIINEHENNFYNKNSRIFIVPKKNVNTIYGIIQPDLFDQTYFVGNGLKSDIVPAIDAGFKTIYIPCETWKFEKDHELHHYEHHPRSTTIKEIKDIIKIYDTL